MTEPFPSPAPINHRARLVRQAEAYILAHLDHPLTLQDLCQVLHTSKSPLFQSFQSVLGMGPMAYVKIQQLHAVRRHLKTADPVTDSVTATAQRFGFWSPGHFARDYQRLFGERPSATLLKHSGWQQLAICFAEATSTTGSARTECLHGTAWSYSVYDLLNLINELLGNSPSLKPLASRHHHP